MNLEIDFENKIITITKTVNFIELYNKLNKMLGDELSEFKLNVKNIVSKEYIYKDNNYSPFNNPYRSYSEPINCKIKLTDDSKKGIIKDEY